MRIIAYNEDMEPSISPNPTELRPVRRPNIPLTIAVFFVFAVVVNLLNAHSVGGDVAWAQSYPAGMAQAKQEGKPILLSLHSPGCVWCRQMDATTFRDKRVVETARRFVCIGLDYSTDGAIIDRYRAVEFPLTIVLHPDGTEIARWTGYLPPDRFLAALQTVGTPRE